VRYATLKPYFSFRAVEIKQVAEEIKEANEEEEDEEGVQAMLTTNVQTNNEKTVFCILPSRIAS